MKREIKFRGLRTDGKGWVYGDLLQFHYENKFYILQFYGIESGDSLFNEVSVIPESVGQFTGLQDKNGVDIYEGDRLNILFGNGYVDNCTISIGHNLGLFIDIIHNIENLNIITMEVIGNIHENK